MSRKYFGNIRVELHPGNFERYYFPLNMAAFHSAGKQDTDL
jgi:hypothetical protein